MNKARPVRVLIVDDSALVRKILADGLSKDPEIEIVGQAGDPYRARDLMVELSPDVITLDVEMPRMDGVTFLRKYMAVMPTPTVMISSLTQEGKRITLDALEAGAVDVVAKPVLGIADGLPLKLSEICQRVKAAAKVDVSRYARQVHLRDAPAAASLGETTDRIIAIGASTGGVQALSHIMPAFPADSPGVVIVQHMPQGFTASFAERLNTLSRMHVKEAEHSDRIMPGQVLLAPGGTRHMSIVRSGGEYRIVLKEGEEVSYARPSVDVLFNSVAAEAGRNVAAAILTGMGRDGAAGLLAIRRAGGRTFAQDEATSIVYGMPQAAYEIGAAGVVAPLENIPALLVQALR
jgi:two-component system, chemotaxis family, protein-glutamate methylesterase/glutaminase